MRSLNLQVCSMASQSIQNTHEQLKKLDKDSHHVWLLSLRLSRRLAFRLWTCRLLSPSSLILRRFLDSSLLLAKCWERSHAPSSKLLLSMTTSSASSNAVSLSARRRFVLLSMLVLPLRCFRLPGRL